MRASFATNRAVISQLLAAYGGRTRNTSESRWATASLQVQERYVTVIAVGGVAILATFLVGGSPVSPLVAYLGGAVVCASLARRYFRNRAERRRREAIDRDLPAFLTTVASSVRAGIDPIRAICDAESYFAPQSPFVSEIRKFKHCIAQGDEEAAVIEGFLVAERNVDLELFKQCLFLSRQLGGSLAEPLHRVVRVFQSRQSFRRKTRAALAMHRMSALGIALCAVVIVGMQFAVDSSRVVMTLYHPVGRVFLGGGVALIVIGVIWMLRMGREERV